MDGFQAYAGGPYADMPMDGPEGNMMHEDYTGSVAYDRQGYPY